MENSEWFQALVIILASMLALFLLLSIIVLVWVIRIVRQIKYIVDQAEETIDKAEHIANFFKSTTAPLAIIKLIANISEAINKASKRRKR